VHGDAVSGILGGAGNLNPYMRGMAPGATLYTVDYDNGFQDITLSLHQIDSVTITNTSYSDGCNTGYTLASQTVDKQMYDNATLFHVFSGGNSNGLSDCGYGAGNQWANVTGGHKMAKNAIAVANLDQFGVIDPESSRGPAHDGRIKPEIAANGTNQMSTDDNNVYLQFGGTSGAAPGVAGCLVQLTHAYKSMHNGDIPEAALLKAVVLNSANDLGNTGPDFIYGFGHINARKALSILENNQYIAAAVAQGATNAPSRCLPAFRKSRSWWSGQTGRQVPTRPEHLSMTSTCDSNPAAATCFFPGN
jgi:subtilisin family serine protease